MPLDAMRASWRAFYMTSINVDRQTSKRQLRCVPPRCKFLTRDKMPPILALVDVSQFAGTRLYRPHASALFGHGEIECRKKLKTRARACVSPLINAAHRGDPNSRYRVAPRCASLFRAESA